MLTARKLQVVALAMLALLPTTTCTPQETWQSGGATDGSLRVAVMDPMSLRLSCPCVGGYAQRRYEGLGIRLQLATGRNVEIVYADRLEKAVRQASGPIDIVIGKRSVVEYDARSLRLGLDLIAALTDRSGSTLLHGVFLVRSTDRARRLRDLRGRTVLVGPPSVAERSTEARAALRRSEALRGTRLTTRETCTSAAADVQARLGDCAVVSSYSVPLLTGCGAVRKGALRAIGKTADVPFIGAYVRRDLATEIAAHVRQALMGVGRDPSLRRELETRDGFVAP